MRSQTLVGHPADTWTGHRKVQSFARDTTFLERHVLLMVLSVLLTLLVVGLALGTGIGLALVEAWNRLSGRA